MIFVLAFLLFTHILDYSFVYLENIDSGYSMIKIV